MWEAAQAALEQLGPFTADTSSRALEAAATLSGVVVRTPAALLHGARLQLLMDLTWALVSARAR